MGRQPGVAGGEVHPVCRMGAIDCDVAKTSINIPINRSEEHTSELQSHA